jgi:hypothetical protein
MLQELNNLLESKPFNYWLKELNGGKDITTLPTKWNLINGLCADLGFYLHVRYKVPIFTISYVIPAYSITTSHVCVLYDGKYYDGWNTEGVMHPSELQWSRLLVDNRQVYDKDTIIIYEGLIGCYDHLIHLSALKEILKKFSLEVGEK